MLLLLTVPWSVTLAAAPPHERVLSPHTTGAAGHRFVGKDLILVDQPADVILDYIRNVIG